MILRTIFQRSARAFRQNAQGGVVLGFALGLPVISVLAAGAVELSEVATPR